MHNGGQTTGHINWNAELSRHVTGMRALEKADVVLIVDYMGELNETAQ